MKNTPFMTWKSLLPQKVPQGPFPASPYPLSLAQSNRSQIFLSSCIV